MHVLTYCTRRQGRHTVRAVCTEQCMHTDIRKSIVQNIALISDSSSVPPQLSSAPFSVVAPDLSTGKKYTPVNSVA